MSVIGGKVIKEHSNFLRAVYDSGELRSFISAVTGGPIYACTNPHEWAVINFLEDVGETHGWHLDDPPFALVVIVEAPPVSVGGLLEFVPGWVEHCEALQVSPEGDVSRPIAALGGGSVRAVHHATGDAYLLRADRCLHRVAPLMVAGHRRIVINFAFEASADPQYGKTATRLYDE
jgi:hypothetical protein